ncbi:hypothetical protein F511_16054 [Dorcoceras hygrometricum]|uniref:Uncharacterized protein n=1 Tax=Dorcoceras hygrometricum TaxID=472368 RepID=A0A2Z7DEK5_9LAMI|nr:hypothetical protein F511_16054 [Dorcoceras hygrometricum]
MLRLVPAGGIACVCLLVVQQKQMSMRVNIPLARRGNVVVSLLRLGVQLRDVRTSGNTVLGIRIRPPARQRKNNKTGAGRRSIRKQQFIIIEYGGPLGSLGLNDAGDDPVDFMSTGAEIMKMLERYSERYGKSHEKDVAKRFCKKGPKEFAGLDLSRTARPSRNCLENLDG